jgi:hypothetical protein
VRNGRSDLALQSQLPWKSYGIFLHVAKLRPGTDGFTSPPKARMLRIFSPENPTASAGFEPVNSGTRVLECVLLDPITVIRWTLLEITFVNFWTIYIGRGFGVYLPEAPRP